MQIGGFGDGDVGALDADSVLFSRASVEESEWDGIRIVTFANDNLTNIKNSIIEYADKGVSIQGASPNITESIFRNNNYAIHSDPSSEPNIQRNTFLENNFPFICALRRLMEIYLEILII